MDNISRARSGDTREAKVSRVDAAYREIKERILNNVYSPGYQAMEQEIAEDLGVSRTPVREALIRLQHEGLVELVPRRGMRVVPMDAADMKEIYDVLTSLESTAAELLAKRRPTESELQPMQQAIDDMEAALESDDLEGWAAADERYHRCLIDLSGNRRLAAMANTVMDQGHRARMVTLRLRPKPTQSNRDHRELLDAIRHGDGKAARDCHDNHRRKSSEVLTDILQKYRLPSL